MFAGRSENILRNFSSKTDSLEFGGVRGNKIDTAHPTSATAVPISGYGNISVLYRETATRLR
jgi:hypothetical protein